jgi:predicted pyridoxine 5'-phosphate oxidase superfamily flavin-nucleotide-binding protein
VATARRRAPDHDWVSATGNSRAEIAKLARLLGLEDPKSLSYLQEAPAAELRDYRLAVTALLYDDPRAMLQRAADAAPLLPIHILSTVGEHALGPMVCARLTGLIAPDRAVEISRHFSIDFLAQLAAELDPRRAVAVVTAMPRKRVVGIAVAMAARGEHVAMGRFVAHLDDKTLMACVQKLTDEDLLRIAFVLEGMERLDHIFDLVGIERTRSMLEGADEMGLGEEARYLVGNLSARHRKQLRSRFSS